MGRLQIDEKLSFELEYLAQKFLWFDLKIILMTFNSVLSSQGGKH